MRAKKSDSVNSSDESGDTSFIGPNPDSTTQTPIADKTRSKTKTENELTLTQLSEQIKLSLSIDENGKLLLQSIAGRPPSVASSKRQGLHTVAWATYESMVANAVNGHSPATAFCNIIALSDSLLGQESTSSLIDGKDINLEAFKKWQDQFNEIKEDDKISSKIKNLALKGKLMEIFPIIEKAIKAILSKQNIREGVAYAVEGNIPSASNEGTEIKTANERLQQLADDLKPNIRKAQRDNIINKVAEEASKLFHYPYVSERQQISNEEKKRLVQEKEYRSLGSFRNNSVDLLAIQISNLLGVLYNDYPNLIGASNDTIYQHATKVVIEKIVNDGNWKDAVENWYKKQPEKQESKSAISFLAEKVMEILHKDSRYLGLFDSINEAEMTDASTGDGRSNRTRSDDSSKPSSNPSELEIASEKLGNNNIRNFTDEELIVELKVRCGDSPNQFDIIQGLIHANIKQNKIIDKDEILNKLEELRNKLLATRIKIDSEKFIEEIITAFENLDIESREIKNPTDNNFVDIVETVKETIERTEHHSLTRGIFLEILNNRCNQERKGSSDIKLVKSK